MSSLEDNFDAYFNIRPFRNLNVQDVELLICAVVPAFRNQIGLFHHLALLHVNIGFRGIEFVSGLAPVQFDQELIGFGGETRENLLHGRFR